MDALILIFDPAMQPSRIAAKRKRTTKQNHCFALAELSRSVLDTLRMARGEPLSIAEIAQRIMIRKRLDTGDARALELIKAVDGYLRRRRPRWLSGFRVKGGACAVADGKLTADSRGGGRPGMEEDGRAPAMAGSYCSGSIPLGQLISLDYSRQGTSGRRAGISSRGRHRCHSVCTGTLVNNPGSYVCRVKKRP